eukprot:Nk52_evm18s2506 gene=Nk52_evmTU18s2506
MSEGRAESVEVGSPKKDREWKEDTKEEAGEQQEKDTVVRLRGLPWSSTEQDIEKFFEGSQIRKRDDAILVTTNRDGKKTGEAYVQFESVEDAKKALEKHKHNMGERYIEVFTSNEEELDIAWQKQRGGGGGRFGGERPAHVLRLRGLPFDVRKEDIIDFFGGLGVTHNHIHICVKYDGRTTGEAYVEFSKEEDKEEGLKKNRENIGSRYIEVFDSNPGEIARARDERGGGHGRGGPMRGRSSFRPSPYDRPPRGGPRERYGGEYDRRGGRGRHGGGPDYDRGYDGHRGGRFGDRYGPPMDDYYYDQPPPRMPYPAEPFVHEGPPSTGFTVKMRGLPYKAVEQDIAEFFSPLPIDRIHIKLDSTGRPSGEAFADFFNEEDLGMAMERHGKRMDSRYIELFRQEGAAPGGGLSPRQGRGDYDSFAALRSNNMRLLPDMPPMDAFGPYGGGRMEEGPGFGRFGGRDGGGERRDMYAGGRDRELGNNSRFRY